MQELLRITPIDDEKSKEGAKAVYRGLTFYIARNSNQKFIKKFQALTKPYKRDIEKGTADEDTMQDIICEAMAYGILVGWEDFEIGGETVQYSRANATNLLKNDPDFRDFVSEFSKIMDNYIREEEDEVVGKSKKSTDGS